MDFALLRCFARFWPLPAVATSESPAGGTHWQWRVEDARTFSLPFFFYQKIRRRPGVDYGQDRSKSVEVSGSCRALLLLGVGVDCALFRAILATSLAGVFKRKLENPQADFSSYRNFFDFSAEEKSLESLSFPHYKLVRESAPFFKLP